MSGTGTLCRRLSRCITAALLAVAVTISGSAAALAVEEEFGHWLSHDLWPEARANGISPETFNAAFAGVRPNLDLPDLVLPGQQDSPPQVQHQAEFRSPGAYFAEGTLAGVTRVGRRHAERHAAVLAALKERYGVAPGILLAIWGRESAFGTATIPHNAFEVLGTKAFLARRKEMYRAEAIAALMMVERGHARVEDMKSSWAGALGQPQFLPTSFLSYAAAFGGSGPPDIWRSEADTLASIASFLAAHGWRRGRDWGFEVTVPDSVSCAQEGPDRGRPIAEWAAMGVERVGGRPYPTHELEGEGYLMMPGGRHGPAFIVTPNFYVLKEYNESDLYALFVGHAGDRIIYGDFRFTAEWRDTDRLYRSDVAAMQRGLERLGYDVGGADGLVGFRTRRSIGAWQEAQGLRPTCFPSSGLVEAFR